jgi:hypothetical protein
MRAPIGAAALRRAAAFGRLQQHQLRSRCAAAARAAPAALAHPVVYHPDFQLSPLPDGHRFPMPKDHLLYLRLQELGLAGRTFTPEPPDVGTLCLVKAGPHSRAGWGARAQLHDPCSPRPMLSPFNCQTSTKTEPVYRY